MEAKLKSSTGGDINHLSDQITMGEQSTNYNETEKLDKEISEMRTELENYKTSQLLTERGISLEQQEINASIVIRGVQVEKKNNSQTELLEVYDKIRKYLGIEEIGDLKAVGANNLQPKKKWSPIKRYSPVAKSICFSIPRTTCAS